MTLLGKRTYLLSAIGVLSAAAGLATHQMTLAQTLTAAVVATGLSTVRAGSKADAAKAAVTTTASVVAELAPVIALTNPKTAKVAGTIGEVAGALSTALAPTQGQPAAQ